MKLAGKMLKELLVADFKKNPKHMLCPKQQKDVWIENLVNKQKQNQKRWRNRKRSNNCVSVESGEQLSMEDE